MPSAGATPPTGRTFDGIDILERVPAGRPVEPRRLFWRQRRGDSTWWAVRDGSLKLIRPAQGAAIVEHLFDLAQDPGEQPRIIRDNGPQFVAEDRTPLGSNPSADPRPEASGEGDGSLALPSASARTLGPTRNQYRARLQNLSVHSYRTSKSFTTSSPESHSLTRICHLPEAADRGRRKGMVRRPSSMRW